jgi:hypothetical protein
MLRFSKQIAHNISHRIAIAAIGIALAAGCANGADAPIETSLDTDFQLHIGETAIILPENIEVSFLEVYADSRCGKGETCVWAGDAALRVNVRINGEESGQYELHSNEREGATASFGEYHIRLLELLPPAISGRAIPPDRYVAVLKIGQGFVGDKNIY